MVTVLNVFYVVVRSFNWWGRKSLFFAVSQLFAGSSVQVQLVINRSLLFELESEDFFFGFFKILDLSLLLNLSLHVFQHLPVLIQLACDALLQCSPLCGLLFGLYLTINHYFSKEIVARHKLNFRPSPTSTKHRSCSDTTIAMMWVVLS